MRASTFSKDYENLKKQNRSISMENMHKVPNQAHVNAMTPMPLPGLIKSAAN